MRIAAAAVLTVAVVSACSEPTAPQPTSDIDLVMSLAADAVPQDVDLLLAHVEYLPDAGCPFDAGSNRYVCAPFTDYNGLTRSLSYAWFDASGAPMTAYDSLATGSVNLRADIGGEILVWTASMLGRDTVSRHRDFTVSNLQGNETTHTWTGSAQGAAHGHYVSPGGFRASFAVVDSVTLSPVTTTSTNYWPTSGTLTRRVVGTVTPDGGTPRQVDQTLTVTFNGTEYGSLVIGSRHYTIDLLMGLIQ